MVDVAPLSFGSLFSGIGGFDLGFERAGMKCLWQVEIDPFCQKVLTKHWPDVKRYGDVKDVGKQNLETVDVICGGFPCQDLSVAGKRQGLAGERSGLWWEFARVIEELRPRWCVIENVPGLLSSWSPVEPPPFEVEARDFDTKEEAERWARSLEGEWDVEETSDLETILFELGQLGYSAAYRIFDAQYFGVAQRRRRVFIVGSITAAGAAQVLFEPESCERDIAPSQEAGEGIAASIKASAPNRRNGGSEPIANEFIVQHALSGHNQRNDPNGEHFVVDARNATIDENVTNTLQAKRSGYSLNAMPLVARPLTYGQTVNHYDESQQTYIAFDTTQITSSENRSNPQPNAPCHPLAEQGHPPMIAYNWQSGGDVRLGFGLPNLQANQVPAVGVRRLTPTECERLQGFPDGWTDDQSDSARYRQLGNAVAVPVAEWIGQQLMKTGGTL